MDHIEAPFVRAGLHLASTEVHGVGVFTREAIPAGAPTINFVGPLLRKREIAPDARYLQVERDLYIADSGGLDDYLNHSCEPNLSFLDGGLMLYARRDIAPGEQLLWDYSTSIDEPGWSFECCCGSPSCRARVCSFCDLPAAEKERLRPFALRFLW